MNTLQRRSGQGLNFDALFPVRFELLQLLQQSQFCSVEKVKYRING